MTPKDEAGVEVMARQRKVKKQPTPAPQAKVSEAQVEVATPPPSLRQQRREKAIAQSENTKRQHLLVMGVLAFTALAYFNSLGGDFVYDDQFQVLKNPSVSSLANIPKMFVQSVWQFMNASSNTPVGLYYRPFFNTVLIINYQIFGTHAIGWHLVSLLLHLCATFLIFKLARRWEMPTEVALAAALLFGLHPAHSESVAWISGLPDPLVAVFCLFSFYCYEKYYRGKTYKDRQTYILVLSLISATLALFSKEVAVVYPAFLALRELYDLDNEDHFFERLKLAFLRTAPFFALIVINFALRYVVLGFISKSDPKAIDYSFKDVLLTIPSAILLYARILFAPVQLSVIYDHNFVREASSPFFWLSALLVVVLFGASLWLIRRSNVSRFAFIWLIIFLLPVLNLRTFNPQESIIHDRYLYIPSVGFCLLIAQAIYSLSQRFKTQQQNIFQAVVIIISITFFALLIPQNATWKNDPTMVENALQYAPNRPFLHNYLGVYYFNQSNLVEAEKAYRKALELNPDFYDSYYNLGDLYRQQGNLVAAEQAYKRAIELGAPYADVFYNLGVVYTSENRLADAEQQLLIAVEQNPTNTSARYNLAWVYDQQGKSTLAEQAYQQTLDYKPDYPEPRINLAILQTKRNALNDALNNLQIAKTYAPDHPIMLYALGDVYLRMNKYQDAITSLSRLIQREPQHRLAYTMLGIGYEGLGNKEQARVYFQKAIEVAPQEPYTNTAREHLAKL
jgi:Flp pilus assembly protein TadD